MSRYINTDALEVVGFTDQEGSFSDGVQWLLEYIDGLPSADIQSHQLTEIEVREWCYKRGLTVIDNALYLEMKSRWSVSAQPEVSTEMSSANDTISRQDAINAVSEYALTHTDLDADKLNGLVKVIMKLPEPVQHGKWLDGQGFAGNYYDCFICDQCKKDSMAKTNYCPHCGAKMEVTS